MKKVITIILIFGVRPLLFGQEVNENQKPILLVKEFMRRVFDMQPFDSIAKLTTLNKNLPKATANYTAGYFTVAMLQFQIHAEKYAYSELSYAPYLALAGRQRTLFYDKSNIDGSRNGRDLTAIYAVHHKTKLVTYVEAKNGKIVGMKAAISPGADYMHVFNMNNVDSVKSIVDLSADRSIKVPVLISKEDGLNVAREFVKFIYDSLNDRSTVKRFYRFQKRLYVEMIDDPTVSFLMEFLKQEMDKIPIEKISVIPYSKLSKKQRRGLDTHDEITDGIFAVMNDKNVITYLCLSGDKIKYFLAFKNLKGRYVFIPYGYSIRRE